MNLYEKVFKKTWPYWVGGVILALLNIVLFHFTGKPWKVTTGFLYWGAWISEKLGLEPLNWYYFNGGGHALREGETFLKNHYTILNGAIIIGALMATLWSSEFKWKKIKNNKQFIFAFLGGIIMGYGTRLSFGCNIGAYFSAIPSFSIHGWIYGIFMFLGAWIGCKILFRYIL